MSSGLLYTLEGRNSFLIRVSAEAFILGNYKNLLILHSNEDQVEDTHTLATNTR